MGDVFRTLIVPSAAAPSAREAAAGISSDCAGMWSTPVSPTGSDPATHYISSGFVPEAILDLEDAIPGIDSSASPPFDAMDRLGLKLVSPPAEY